MIRSNWYLVYTKPNQERRAYSNLVNQGLEVFLPQICVLGKTTTKTKKTLVPMFPRYLFVRINIQQDNWPVLRSTKGVNHLVTFGDLPAIVPIDVINLLKFFCTEEGVINQDKLSKQFIKGELVYIDDGLLAGHEAIFLHQNSKKRVMVLLELADKETTIQIPSDHLAPKMALE